MNLAPVRATLLSVACLAFATVASAHPGHDGHEVTWDFEHLAAHPVATLGCAVVVGVAAWVLVSVLGARQTRLQSLRKSADNPRK